MAESSLELYTAIATQGKQQKNLRRVYIQSVISLYYFYSDGVRKAENSKIFKGRLVLFGRNCIL